MPVKAERRMQDRAERTRLETVIPLETPFIIFVDPSSVCNLGCKFCPCGNAHKDLWTKEKKTGLLSYEMFRKIVDGCREFPGRIKVLRLYKEGEPLINKRLPDMVRYAKNAGIAESIDFTSNAVLLGHDLSLALIDAGLDRINISIEALTADEYEDVCGARIDFEKFIENIRFFYENRRQCHVFIKTTDKSLGSHTEDDFYKMFGEICDGMDVEKVASVWPEFELDGSFTGIDDKNLFGEEVSSNLVCPYVFYQMCINSDGTVSSCLMDWNHKLVVGDVSHETVYGIWNGRHMNQMRSSQLEGNRGQIPVCRDCGQLKYGGVVDNIDDYRIELLEKVRNATEKEPRVCRKL